MLRPKYKDASSSVNYVSVFLKFIEYGIPVDSDEVYEDSEEADGVHLQTHSRGRKLQEGIVDIASIILLNMSQICPINQTNYFNFVQKLVSSSLNEIHEPGHGFVGEVAYFEVTIPKIQRFLQACTPKLPKITNEALERDTNPETIVKRNT
ncbi:unnamed protein product [Orchesella dallaii]|uniref:Uncharacterized protein n=1 Tax=Orchesella dallaii TaxID=48710 RepID=A0ABP1R0Z4_9HEXA